MLVAIYPTPVAYSHSEMCREVGIGGYPNNPASKYVVSSLNSYLEQRLSINTANLI